MSMIHERAFDGKSADKSTAQTSFDGKSVVSERDVDRIVERLQATLASDMPADQLSRLRDGLTKAIKETLVHESDDRRSRQSSRRSNDHTLQTEHEFVPLVAVEPQPQTQPRFVHACCKTKLETGGMMSRDRKSGSSSREKTGKDRPLSKDKKTAGNLNKGKASSKYRQAQPKTKQAGEDRPKLSAGKQASEVKQEQTLGKQIVETLVTDEDRRQEELQLNESTVMRASNNQAADDDGHQDIFEALDMMQKRLLEPTPADQTAKLLATDKPNLKSRG